MPPNPLESGHKGKPWPGYFLVRTTGEVVPLIAVDELPLGIELVGIPRSLGLEETVGMLNLGLQRSTSSHYHILSGDERKAESSQTKERINGLAATAPAPTKSAPAVPTTTPDSTPPSTPKTSNISRLARPNPETILCRHWCHHGICKWGQQCRYRHIMPMTLQGLHEVGLSDWPSWYRKLNPGYFINDVQGPGPASMGGRSRNRACTAGGGHGGACCGVLHDGGRERRMTGSNRAPRERGILRGSKSEELGEQIISRLRTMAKDGKVVATEKGSAIIERATTRDTKNWEDESEDSDDGTSPAKGQHIEEVLGNLVDV